MTGLPLRFAVRYLFARKSYNVINMISGIGVAGMAIGTAALIVILSVFNGFNTLVSESLGNAHPDLSVRPAAGKVFTPDMEAWDWAMEDPDILRISSTLEDQVFISYEGHQSLAHLKGLDSVLEAESPLREHLVDGAWQLHKGSLPTAVCGYTLAHSLGLSPRFVTPLEIYYPSRTEPVSMINPAASLHTERLQLSGVISINAELDATLLLVPLETARELLDYTTEVSAIEVWTAEGAQKSVKKQLQKQLGPDYLVLDRYEQNASLYKMMRAEKLSIYIILIFVVLVIAFNIYSSLKMLIIEKQGDRGTLRSMGAPEEMVRRIFCLEGWLVTLLGMTIGLVVGLVLVWLQDRFGLIPMPGNYIVDAYPVVLKATDVLWTVLGVAGVGYLIAFFPTRKL